MSDFHTFMFHYIFGGLGTSGLDVIKQRLVRQGHLPASALNYLSYLSRTGRLVP